MLIQAQKLPRPLYNEGGKAVHYLLQLSERWLCHTWPVGRMKIASLETKLVEVRPFSLSPSIFSLSLFLPLSLFLSLSPTKSLDMTKI